MNAFMFTFTRYDPLMSFQGTPHGCDAAEAAMRN
jgi:hypothetical protein